LSVTDTSRGAAQQSAQSNGGRQAAHAAWSAGVIAIAALGIVTVAAIATFDLGPKLAFNDDYAYSWSARHLFAGPIYPQQTALALPQIAIGWLVSLPFGHDQRALRISVLIAILLGAFAAYRLASRLGAGRKWALMAPLVILTSPIFFNLAITFMSDVAYIGLLLLACNAGASWLENDRARPSFVVWASLATLQRVFGVVVVAALAIALVLRARRRGRWLDRSDAAWLASAVLGSAAAAVLPGLLGISAGLNVVDRLTHVDAAALLNPMVHLPVIAGYLVLPLLGAIAVEWNRRSVAIAVVGAALVLLLLWRFPWLPGNIWTFVGPAPTLPGPKEPPVSLAVNLVLITLSPVVFLFIGPAASDRWAAAARADLRFVFLLVVSGAQLALLIPNTLTLFDRYYLPVLAPVVPMVCALAQRYSRPGGLVTATVVCAGLIALSTVYELDYQSWQTARDAAALLAYRCAPPDRVNAGYEANAVYVEIPAYEATGKFPLGRIGRLLTIYGPPNPALQLEYAGPTDPRPGVVYGVLTRGKVALTGAVCSAATADGAR
jgi:dolichyl-phosphate-mannose-protein mannosyltransferase